MTREETIKLLSILKAAYPNSYKGMTRDEANGTISVWAMHFSKIPADIVLIAVNKIISKSAFPPSINEVKSELSALYYEAAELIRENVYATEGLKISDSSDEVIYYGTPLEESKLNKLKEICEVTGYLRGGNDFSLIDMLNNKNQILIAENASN